MSEINVFKPEELQNFETEKLESLKWEVFKYWQVLDAVLTIKKAEQKLK